MVSRVPKGDPRYQVMIGTGNLMFAKKSGSPENREKAVKTMN